MRFASLLFVTSLTLLFAVSCDKADPEVQDTNAVEGEKWRVTKDDGLDTPESAYYHADTGHVYVSNIVGSGKDKDGTGYISKLTTDGKVVKKEWATGLDAPKGLRAHGDTLWVTNLTEIVGMDLKTGEVTKRVPIEGSQFLNDLATADDGTIYIADTLGGKVFQYRDGKSSVFFSGEEAESPNGLLVVGDQLIVGGWGIDVADDFSTRVLGRLYSLDRKTAKKTLITKEPLGNIDGVELDGQGGYILTDWKAGKVLQVDAKGNSKVLLTLKQGAADIAYLPESRTLIVPQMLDSYLLGIELKK